MQIKKYEHKLIQKALKRYKYHEEINQDETNEDFMYSYSFHTKKKRGRKGSGIFDNLYIVLGGTPNCKHIAAKNLLFQGNDECWKFFERTAQFYTYTFKGWSIMFIDSYASSLQYALYVERMDLIELLLNKVLEDLERDEYKHNKNYIKQKVYPSIYLLHFLIEKLGIPNPVKDKIMQYGDGLGIYERIVAEWDQPFSEIEDAYWDSLCEHHLKGIGVTGTRWKDEEFLYAGLVPMELINLFKVRQKLGLDVPVIKHELFSTPMAVYPKIPTGYDAALDVKFQLVERTMKDKKIYTLEEIAAQLKEEYGEKAEIFY